MVGALLTDRDELEELFEELADELAQLGTSAEIVIVGGAWMLWHSQRLSTRDVDSARRFDSDLSKAVESVGARHDLPRRSGRQLLATTLARWCINMQHWLSVRQVPTLYL